VAAGEWIQVRNSNCQCTAAAGDLMCSVRCVQCALRFIAQFRQPSNRPTRALGPLWPHHAKNHTLQCLQGRATFYGTDERVEASRVACGEPEGQFGIIAQGSCGYTNSDGSLPFPREAYAALADANEDYPGSCGRCYQVKKQCAGALIHTNPCKFHIAYGLEPTQRCIAHG
jgi:hypothetical protein